MQRENQEHGMNISYFRRDHESLLHIAEDKLQDFSLANTVRKIILLKAEESKVKWLNTKDLQDELNYAIKARKSELHPIGLQEPVYYAEIIRYALNKKMQLFIRELAGESPKCYDYLILYGYERAKIAKIKSFELDGIQLATFIESNKGSTESVLRGVLQNIKEIKIDAYVPAEPFEWDEQTTTRSNQKKIFENFLAFNCFNDITETIFYLTGCIQIEEQENHQNA